MTMLRKSRSHALKTMGTHTLLALANVELAFWFEMLTSDTPMGTGPLIDERDAEKSSSYQEEEVPKRKW
jgi:hypothetical protein